MARLDPGLTEIYLWSAKPIPTRIGRSRYCDTRTDDLKYLRTQPHGPLPVSAEWGRHYVNLLIEITPGGLGHSAKQAVKTALRFASQDAAPDMPEAQLPFSAAKERRHGGERSALRHKYGVGKESELVHAITATMLGQMEQHMPVTVRQAEKRAEDPTIVSHRHEDDWRPRFYEVRAVGRVQEAAALVTVASCTGG